MDDKSFSVHISVSNRHLVEKDWLPLPPAVIWNILTEAGYDVTSCWSYTFHQRGWKTAITKIVFFPSVVPEIGS